MLSLFFGRKLYFLRQLDIELMKLSDPHIYDETIVYDKRKLEDLPLCEIGRIDPMLERELRDGAFEKSLDSEGYYFCAECGTRDTSRIYFQVDHIIPMNNGGKTRPENLQILCRSCNARKSDK